MIAVGATIAVVGAIFAWRESQRTHADTASTKPAHELTATDLVNAFLEDEDQARARFTGDHGKVLLVRGTVREVERVNDALTNVVLETGDEATGVICEFGSDDLPATLAAGRPIAIKGVCKDIIKDDLFDRTDVLLQRCVAVP